MDKVLLETLEVETDCKQAVNDQMESNLILRIQVDDLQKRLEEKDHKLTQAQETIRILRDEVQSLQKQLDVVKRKYLDLVVQRPRASHSIQPDSEAKSKACVDEQPTLTLYCESEPDPTDPSGQRSSFPALPSSSSPSSQSCTDIAVEVDRLTTATNGKVELHRPHETHQTPSTYSQSDTEKCSEPLLLQRVLVTLEDCTQKLGPDGSLIVQGLDEDEDDGGGHDDYTMERESYRDQSTNGPSLLSSEEKSLELRQNRAFECNQCNKTFSQPNHLKLHQRTHSKNPRQTHGLHKCGTCGKYFPSRSALHIHERVHTGEKPYVCAACGHAFSQRGNLKTHQLSKHPEKSPLGDTGPPALAEEISSSSTQFPGDQRKCEDCGKVFPFPSLLRVHRRIHTGERPFACSTCGKTFSQSGNLRTHMQTHEDDDLAEGNADSPVRVGGAKALSRVKPHECTECGKAFAFRAQLRAHFRKHTGEKPYACDVCAKAFRQRSSLQVHQLLRHNKAGRLRGFECSKCGKKLQSQSALLIHQRTHSRDKPYACTLCEKRFSRPENFQQHQRWHANDLRHLCSHCGKLFVTASKLKQHILQHTGEKPFSCPQCSKTFTSSSGLKQHSQIHTGEMPYRCCTCDKAFKFLSNLRGHERIHKQERPYLCHLCGKTFSERSSLSRHQKTHTNDRRYECPHCDQRFLMSSNLRRHLLRHTGQRPHLCSVCGKAFSRPEILKTHQRIHTGEKPYQCGVCSERFAYVQSLQSHQKREHPTHEQPLNGGQRRPRCAESSDAPPNLETQSSA